MSEPVATTLVRRGYRTLESAREFLDAVEPPRPVRVRGDGATSSERLLEAVAGRRARSRSTATTTSTGCARPRSSSAPCARSAGRCDWFIPDRLGDGYGLTAAGVERLAARGTELLITTDCGIAATAEVAAARAAGVEVIVTDHHTPGDELPECPIVHPRLCGYPCPDLCATGVAYKLSAALRERAGIDAGGADADLDLVALATVADLVPLTGENRALVRRGLAELRRAGRPGLRGLDVRRRGRALAARRGRSRVPARAADKRRRAPVPRRRRRRADAVRGRGVAPPRSPTSSTAPTASGATRSSRCLPARSRRSRGCPGGAEAPALVIAGEGWHPGVVGIVASRLAERHYRPVVLIGLEPGGSGRGSGRSIPAFDLLAGLRECSEHLVRFGGHRAAAGLEIEAGRVDAFREAFVALRRGVAAGRGPRPDRDRRRRRRRRPAGARRGRGARAPRAVRDGQPASSAAGPRGPDARRASDGRRQARPVQRPERSGARARGGVRRQRIAGLARGLAGGPLRSPRAQPVERRRRAAGRARGSVPAHRFDSWDAPSRPSRRSGGSGSRRSYSARSTSGRRRGSGKRRTAPGPFARSSSGRPARGSRRSPTSYRAARRSSRCARTPRAAARSRSARTRAASGAGPPCTPAVAARATRWARGSGTWWMPGRGCCSPTGRRWPATPACPRPSSTSC